MKCQEIIRLLEELSPKQYACDWDNVGLLVGRRNKDIRKILVSLDASKEVISYAVEQKADLLITHHPMIFSSMKKINEDDFTAEKVLSLAENGICCFAMHTNFDAVGGMAELAAGPEYLNLADTCPIEICASDIMSTKQEGMGRYGRLPKPMTAEEVAAYVKEKFNLPFVMLYQDKAHYGKIFDRIAVMPGAGKSEMQAVFQNGYDLYLTGDYGHHSGMDAMDMGMTIIDATHYGLEHIFTEYIVRYLRENLSNDILVDSIDMGNPIKVI